MSKYEYQIEAKVRDYECDLFGVVNNANYLHYLEHTRNEFLFSLGLGLSDLKKKGINTLVARISISFKVPLKSGDYFVSKLRLKKEKFKYVFFQEIFRKQDNKLSARATVEVVSTINGHLSNCELIDEVFKPYLSE